MNPTDTTSPSHGILVDPRPRSLLLLNGTPNATTPQIYLVVVADLKRRHPTLTVTVTYCFFLQMSGDTPPRWWQKKVIRAGATNSNKMSNACMTPSKPTAAHRAGARAKKRSPNARGATALTVLLLLAPTAGAKGASGNGAETHPGSPKLVHPAYAGLPERGSAAGPHQVIALAAPGGGERGHVAEADRRMLPHEPQERKKINVETPRSVRAPDEAERSHEADAGHGEPLREKKKKRMLSTTETDKEAAKSVRAPSEADQSHEAEAGRGEPLREKREKVEMCTKKFDVKMPEMTQITPTVLLPPPPPDMPDNPDDRPAACLAEPAAAKSTAAVAAASVVAAAAKPFAAVAVAAAAEPFAAVAQPAAALAAFLLREQGHPEDGGPSVQR